MATELSCLITRSALEQINYEVTYIDTAEGKKTPDFLATYGNETILVEAKERSELRELGVLKQKAQSHPGTAVPFTVRSRNSNDFSNSVIKGNQQLSDYSNKQDFAGPRILAIVFPHQDEIALDEFTNEFFGIGHIVHIEGDGRSPRHLECL